jgi:membrane fusion protein, multidrug efflux system
MIWRRRERVAATAALLVLAAGAGAVLGAGPGGGAGGGAPAVPVVTGLVEARPVPVLAQAVGTVEPIESVSVRPQVGGVITEVAFTDGQDVRAGQKLFQIDPRPLQAALAAAQAQLARDKAQAANATAQSERYARLVAKDYVTREQADAARTQADVFAAAVQADQAAVDQAKLNLAYAAVSSPVAGRAGAALVKKGNVVTANGGPLVVVNQLAPIRVAFALPGNRLPEVRRCQAAGPLTVRARPSGAAAAAAATGRLVFVDNAVAPNTGTVALKALFDNTDESLWPGQFVDVELQLALEPAALTVPAAAVVTGQAGTFVYVVDEAGKAQKHAVTVRRTVEGLAVVEGDLTPGQTVIVDGQIRVVPGGAVQAKGAGAGGAAPAAQPQGGGK